MTAKRGPMLQTYPVLVCIRVEATTEDEARLLVERLLAGRFDHRFVALVDTKGRT